MDKNKIFIVLSIFIVLLMSMISISLLSRFQELQGLQVLNEYGLNDLRNKNPQYFATQDGLIGLDALIIILTFFGLQVFGNPNKNTKYAFNALQGLFLIIRFILSVIFLDNPGENLVENLTNFQQTIANSPATYGPDITLYMNSWSQSYTNEIASAVIIPLFQIMSMGAMQKLQVEAN